MKELNFDWLLNGSCLLSDVAMAYFTTCVYPRSAGKRSPHSRGKQQQQPLAAVWHKAQVPRLHRVEHHAVQPGRHAAHTVRVNAQPRDPLPA